MNTVLDHSALIKSALNITDDELQDYAANGSVKVFSEPLPAGYATIAELPGGTAIAANQYVRYRHQAYAEELAVVRRERAAGRNNFHHILYQLRTMNPVPSAKAAMMGFRKAYGHGVMRHPFMGSIIEMRADMCVPFHHFAIQHVLAGKLTADFDAVFDIGAGTGDSLAELAARTPWPHITYYGGEISKNGLACMAEFADLLHMDNIHGVPFDFSAPDFSFLKGKKKVLAFSQFALVYANPFPEQFMLDLLEAADDVTVVMFEPLSFAMAETLGNKPIFDRARAKTYGICENLWPRIKALEAQGKIVIEDAVPDFIGKALLSTVSLVAFRKKK